jgi:hypothetical protein
MDSLILLPTEVCEEVVNVNCYYSAAPLRRRVKFRRTSRSRAATQRINEEKNRIVDYAVTGIMQKKL